MRRAGQRTVGPPIRPKPATLHFASIPKERATGGRISPSVACADGRVATRRFGRGPGHLSVIGAWSKAEAVRDGPPKPAPGASSSLPPAPGTATPRGTGGAVIRCSSRCSPPMFSKDRRRPAAVWEAPTAFGSPIGKEGRAVVETDSEEELPEDLPFRPPAASSDRIAATLRHASQNPKPGGARWGPSPGRSRQPHIALAPPEGRATADGIAPCHVRRRKCSGAPRARRRHYERIEDLDSPPPSRESVSGHRRTKVERRREEWREDGDPFPDLPPRGSRNRAPGKLRSANCREEWRTVGPPPRAEARQPHIALASPEGTGYGSGNRTVSRAPPGNVAPW